MFKHKTGSLKFSVCSLLITTKIMWKSCYIYPPSLELINKNFIIIIFVHS